MTTIHALLQTRRRAPSRMRCPSSLFTAIKLIVVFTVYMVGVALLDPRRSGRSRPGFRTDTVRTAWAFTG
jgi:hypothetical protein